MCRMRHRQAGEGRATAAIKSLYGLKFVAACLLLHFSLFAQQAAASRSSYGATHSDLLAAAVANSTGRQKGNTVDAQLQIRISDQQRQLHLDPPVVPAYELVIARFREHLDWLAEVPSFWAITVYSKGGNDSKVPPIKGRPFSVVELSNRGNEGESYAHHIVERVASLADYTVFAQADPFEHSRHFLDLLRNPAMLGTVQAMSQVFRQGSGDPGSTTPSEVIEAYSRNPWARAERISLRTMNSVYFHDEGTITIMKHYCHVHQVPIGTNLIAHYLGAMGLPGWVPTSQEVGSFAYGGIFGVHKLNIEQHSREVYENIRATLAVDMISGYVQERSWLMLFGGSDFRDV